MVGGIDIKPNQSFIFLLPLFDIKNTNVIVNTYLGSSVGGLFNDSLYILAYVKSDELERHNDLLNSYVVSDNMIIYELKFPEEYLNDYYVFLEGKYSKYSRKAKDTIINKFARNCGKAAKDTVIYAIFYRTDKRRKQLENDLDVKLPDDAEYASIFNENLEIYEL